jgi:hypothetical protein
MQFCILFLSSGGTSTGADVAGWLAGWVCLSLQKIGLVILF